ncbi:MAG: phenylacetate-CoA oxygenase subunit PaaC [Bacteroidetes bacterium]|nr:phenylacetate-CoA oxygenase subunit PaaC [Bacteroidota bacterium]
MQEALKSLLLSLADDLLVIGHRNSEWTGMGPVLEEDIAFASMAQDKIGHALAFYELLHSLGEPEPDILAFTRQAADFRSCQLVEYPIGEYDFSLVRHFLFDYAYTTRLEALKSGSYAPLAALSERFLRELKYHTLHARTWVAQLGNATEEARLRMQSALNEALPMAYGIFEETPHTAGLVAEGIQPHEQELRDRWLAGISALIAGTPLKLPQPTAGDIRPYLGGRQGRHSEHLQPLLTEMTEVFAIDPAAAW